MLIESLGDGGGQGRACVVVSVRGAAFFECMSPCEDDNCRSGQSEAGFEGAKWVGFRWKARFLKIGTKLYNFLVQKYQEP